MAKKEKDVLRITDSRVISPDWGRHGVGDRAGKDGRRRRQDVGHDDTDEVLDTLCIPVGDALEMLEVKDE